MNNYITLYHIMQMGPVTHYILALWWKLYLVFNRVQSKKFTVAGVDFTEYIRMSDEASEALKM